MNDAHGHREGDRVLCAFAELLLRTTRRADTVARLGGDEFALILPGTDVAGTRAVLAKLGRLLGRLEEPTMRNLTCSIGAVVLREQPASAEDAVAVADGVMYEAKSRGKNTEVIRVHPRSGIEEGMRGMAGGGGESS